MVSAVPLIVLLLSFLPSIYAGINFTSPANWPYSSKLSQNPSYKLGQTIYIEWVSDAYHLFDLVVAAFYTLNHTFLLSNSTKTSYNWPVTWDNITALDGIGNDYVFQFFLSPANKDQWDAESQPFNITIDPKEGFSNKAVAGISVGSTLGGLVILGGVVFLAWRGSRHIKDFLAWRSARKTEKAAYDTEIPPAQPPHMISTTTAPGDPNHIRTPQDPTPVYSKSVFEGQQHLQSPQLPPTNNVMTEIQSGQNGHPSRQHTTQTPGGMYEIP
ncbi:hypothetical protein B0J13DRAFT_612284 [Dactylonectria estremocensis]|uniref:Uncharacterized protein n=1 Tax=Dactylonectria estremocensis TaxID=1079267 RepID=A0A9P9IJS8_9HYPO|nr:hypothetical protein B0J13DRAFT_612284 [Dactylonectria estremocensis]